MIATTYITHADADAIMCDMRRIDDMMHYLIVPVFSMIIAPDVSTACQRVVNQMNSDSVRVFDVTLKLEPVAKLIMRQF